jgi:DNA-directed RNA polymerase specialized sigma24 family protein
VQERSYAEIAELLGIPRGTVMSRLYNARMALRQEYLRAGAQAPAPRKSHP